MKYYLETSRMKLRELSLLDEDLIFDLDSDPEVVKYITGGKASTREEINQALKRTEDLLKKHQGRFGYWAAMEKVTDQFLGWFHFRPSKQDPENTKRIELGYRLKKEYWGRGLAAEGSRALIKKGFEELGVQEVFALTLKDHLASQRVMEKVGLKFKREFISPDFPGSDLLDVEYALSLRDYSDQELRDHS